VCNNAVCDEIMYYQLLINVGCYFQHKSLKLRSEYCMCGQARTCIKSDENEDLTEAEPLSR